MADNQPTLSDFEEWRDIPGHEGYYQASSHGRIRSLDRIGVMKNGIKRRYPGVIIKQFPHSVTGHLLVRLSKDGKGATRKVHQLVLESFVGPAPEGMMCCHWDDDPTNNHIDNLRWGTKSENMRDSVRNGKHNMTKKTHCPQGHSLSSPNLVAGGLKKDARLCKACNRARGYLQSRPDVTASYQEVSDSYYGQIMGKAA